MNTSLWFWIACCNLGGWRAGNATAAFVGWHTVKTRTASCGSSSHIVPLLKLSSRIDGWYRTERDGRSSSSFRVLHSSNNKNDDEIERSSVLDSLLTRNDNNSSTDDMIIVRGSTDDTELPDQVWEDIETGEPPEWIVMKELLGINIVTYVLAAAIAVFLSLNALLGPGWLGQAIGIQGAGHFTDVAASLPDTVDLNGPENLL